MKKKSVSLVGGSTVPVGRLAAATAGMAGVPAGSGGAPLANPIGGHHGLVGHRLI